MPSFSGTLNINEIFSTMRNMIISQQTFSGNIKGVGGSLVDKARVDGSQFGDTKLYISTNALKAYDWSGDSEASNLLSLDRPENPQVQAIVLNKFKQVRVTTDDVLSKRAFMTSEVFVEFNGIMLAWLRDTKKVYDGTLYAAFFGTNITTTGKQSIQVDLRSASSGQPLYGLTGVEKEQMEAMLIARSIADLLVEMKDVSTDFNDYQQLRSYDDEEIKIVWNSKWVNKIRKIDLPTIFHKDALVDKFEENVLPAKYFGTVITSSNLSNFSASTPTTGKPINSTSHAYTPGSNNANGCIRSLVEKDVVVSSTTYHVRPGFEIPAGALVVANPGSPTGGFDMGEVYMEESDCICKIVTVYPPLMSAWEIGSEFWNPRSLTRNNYLTFAHNTLEHLKGKPFITVKANA